MLDQELHLSLILSCHRLVERRPLLVVTGIQLGALVDQLIRQQGRVA